MSTHEMGIIMNGVTGRMGTNQHLIRSLLAIQIQGGIKVGDDDVIMPLPVLVGRNGDKLRRLSHTHGDLPWSTNLDDVLRHDRYSVYFDAQSTPQRYDGVMRAIRAGKHVYCEKPVAMTVREAMALYEAAREAGVKHGVVQDKLWLPGFLKLKYLIDTGFFGELLAVRGEFGYWVFTGEHQSAQRPSWNYRKAGGGGIIFDMLCHWRYLIDNLFGNVTALTCLGANHIKERWDEQGQRYDSDADDAAYATFLTDRGVICHFNSSWCTRVRRDDLLTVQVDGVRGSAVAGLRECWVQHDAETPKPVWNPDIPNPIDFRSGWMPVPSNVQYDNAFKTEWELFLRHVAFDEPFRWDLREGAKGVQLAELGIESWNKRAWVDVPDLD
ncbi:MAG: Gfo/Idh/MocA family oxidoreductase [Candidatus Hydrogenedentes bacterium]|nr:Gfo/Idh/MocA family oxidoreductase [Candidatus Hydrogenedentota bacterium]